MVFKDDDITKMRRIFKRLAPRTIESIQDFDNFRPLRTDCIFGIKSKYLGYICIFQNFETLSPAQTKILEKMRKNVPFELHITHPAEGITRLGWKCV